MDSTSTQQLIESYQTLIEQQSSTYSTLFYVFLTIMIIIVGSVLYINFVASKRAMRREIRNTFEEEKSKLYDEIKKRFESEKEELNKKALDIEGNLSRLAASYCLSLDSPGKAAEWAITSLDCYLKLNNNWAIRKVTEFLLGVLLIDEWKQKIREEAIDLGNFKIVAEKIPDFMDEERGKIIGIIEAAQKELGQV